MNQFCSEMYVFKKHCITQPKTNTLFPLYELGTNKKNSFFYLNVATVEEKTYACKGLGTGYLKEIGKKSY